KMKRIQKVEKIGVIGQNEEAEILFNQKRGHGRGRGHVRGSRLKESGHGRGSVKPTISTIINDSDFIHEGENNIKKGHEIRKEGEKTNIELSVPIANIDDSYSSYEREMSFGKISLNNVNVEEPSNQRRIKKHNYAELMIPDDLNITNKSNVIENIFDERKTQKRNYQQHESINYSEELHQNHRQNKITALLQVVDSDDSDDN
ncbi:16564_t:CDS:2, partial [Funneliformis geosporum]